MALGVYYNKFLFKDSSQYTLRSKCPLTFPYMETKVKTRSVTNTQIAVAVGIAILASGLAFAAAPNRKNRAPACTTQSIEFVDSCPKGGKYHTATYVCSDGSSGRAVGKACRTIAKLQQVVDRACSRKQCSGTPAAAPAAVAPAPVAAAVVATPVATPVVEPSPTDANQCGLQDIRYAASCGRNKYEKVEFTCTDGYSASQDSNCSSLSALQEAAVTACAYRDCRVPQIQLTTTNAPSETDTRTDSTVQSLTNSAESPALQQKYNSIQKLVKKVELDNSAAPIVFISGTGPTFRSESTGKVIVGISFSNRGTAVAGSDVKYSLYFLDGQKNVLQNIDLNLSSELGIGEEKVFETVLPIPAEALFAQVVVDKSFSDGRDNDFTSMIPIDLFIR